MRSRSPIGSWAPNNSRRMVAPMTQTEAPARSSLSENTRPSASVQSCTANQSELVPVTEVS